MSQNGRVLAALRRGPVNPRDFDLPNVIDDGPPILRLAARVGVLRERGHQITSAKQPNGTATYTLIREADAQRSGPAPTETPLDSRAAVVSASLGATRAPAADGRPHPRLSAATLFDWPVAA